jgi:hypothetical protein
MYSEPLCESPCLRTYLAHTLEIINKLVPKTLAPILSEVLVIIGWKRSL